MQKKTVPEEIMYVLGIVFIALGVAFMARADFGVSMVVAPAYVLHLWLVKTLPWFSFGTSEYVVQAFIFLVTVIAVRKFKVSYLVSFATAFVYGLVLDLFMLLTEPLITDALVPKLVYYVVGLLLSSFGVTCMFHTYIAPEVYELCVKEVSAAYKIDIGKFKTCYDIASLTLAILLSFVLNGWLKFIGIGVGTIFCALVNGTVIGLMDKWITKRFTFKRLLQR